ncbi:ATP-binding protein [Tenggerimyces flavus]|uniref:ATP-binding protein n=1 Tax=Tenggerimyces flavus TaxID=1708749 RepID=A0ABV7YRV5_9ACTN|nr:ATP-binding protein [Tenggerimyces flavus]MBM7784629.1 DNA helicase HerA-like ATPase [Tenggerimyces flavus]
MSGVAGSSMPNGLVRVVELPRPLDDAAQVTDPDGVRRLASVIAAYHSAAAGPATVLFGWLRTRTGGPVEILTAGPSLLPPASRAVPASDKQFAELPAWSRLVPRHDGLLVGESEPADPNRRAPSLEGSLLSVWNEPFALVTLAEQVRPADVHRLLEEVGDGARQAMTRAEQSPVRAVEHDRLNARLRELREAESLGLWRVRVLLAGASDGAVRALAGLVAASIDLTGLPYSLAPDRLAGTFDEVAAADEGTLAGSRLVAALTRTPTAEVPGIRLALSSDFDITPESSEGPGLVLGEVLDRERRPAGELVLPFASLNRHTFVCGATGAGKSQTVRALLTEATRAGIPWLVVEPAKAEYRKMAARLRAASLDEPVVVIRPGDPSGVPAGIDPLRPQPGFALQTHLDLVRALFLAAFDADEPFPQVLSAALTRSYEEQGWDVALGEPVHPDHVPRYPTLADLERAAMQVVEEIGYSREITDNVRGFVRVRLGSLRMGTTGRFLEGGHQVDLGKLLSRNVVLEIEDVGDDRDKAFLIGVVLIALTEHHRAAQGRLDSAVSLRHLTVVEEAHRLLRRTDRPGPAAQAVEMFAALLAEIRAYGEGLVVAEQIPSKLIPDVIKNTAVKIVHRLPALDDRESVGATMNLSDNQSRYVVTLDPGVAAAFTDGMDNPLLVRVPDGSSSELGAVSVGSAAEVAVPQSGRCGADYRLLGLSASDLALAQRYLDGDPLLRLWVELNVVSHLVGRPGIPGSLRLLKELVASSVSLEAVVAAAVDDAVARRSAFIHDAVTPELLAGHVAEVLVSMARGGPPCAGGERWLMAPGRPDVEAFVESLWGVDRSMPGWDERLHDALAELAAPAWVLDYFAGAGPSEPTG